MVQPRLGILSTIDTELTRVSELVTAQDFSGELVSVDAATGLATVRVRPPLPLLRVHGTVS